MMGGWREKDTGGQGSATCTVRDRVAKGGDMM